MNQVERAKKRVFRRKMRVRNRIRSARNPRTRLSVFKTSKHMYVQLIDDQQGKTLCATSTLSKEIRASNPNGGNVAAAKAVGAEIAKLAKEAGVTQVAFDRGAFRYHGRIKALADAAREGGLSF